MRRALVFVAIGLGFGLIVLAAMFAPQQEPVLRDTRPGKDVIYLPTDRMMVTQMLDLAVVRPSDVVVDLGSGDGRLVIAAAKRGATARGIEYNADLVDEARRLAAFENVADRARFDQGDIFESDFSDATVVTMFLLPNLNLRLKPTLQAMRPGTRVVSNSFDMNDWDPDDAVNLGPDCVTACRAFLWIIPARAAGTWGSSQGDELILTQKDQMLAGTFRRSGGVAVPGQGRVRGETFTFAGRGYQLTGRIAAAELNGRRRGPDGEAAFVATRRAP